MLYLIQVSDIETGIKLLKIGYSDNWDNRKSQYIASNPLTSFISTKEGDEILEKLFHLRYDNYIYPKYGKEWFYYNPEIVDGFKNYEESDLLKYLWNNREDILNLTYFRSDGLQKQILVKLYGSKMRKDLDYRNKYDVLWDSEHLLSEASNIGIHDFISRFNKLTRFNEKLRLYCETEMPVETRDKIDSQISIEYSNYYKLLGPSICKSKCYKKSELRKEYDKQLRKSNNSFLESIKSEFPITNLDGIPIFYPNRDVKQKLQELYVKHNILQKAKSTDIAKFFEAEETVRRIDKQIIRGYYLLSSKL